MSKKILVAYDGSLMSRNALEEAKTQAKYASEAEIHVISIIKPTGPSTNKAVSQSIGNQLLEELRPQMQKIKEEFEKENLSTFTDIILAKANTNPGAEVCQYATDNEIDLIIVGSRGLGNIKGMFLGSVSNNIVQNATCPILIMK